MATKYFCDRCGEETKYEELKSVELAFFDRPEDKDVVYPGGAEDVSDEFCESCIRQITRQFKDSLSPDPEVSS